MKIIEADCIDAMRDMDEASIDAIVTDPPYGLEFMGKEWDRLQGYTADIGFKSFTLPRQRRRNIKCPECGKYIYDHPGRRCECGGVRRKQVRSAQEWHQAWATEALRVLKPGGHLLAFGGTRTSHRLACAIEDAGFEIRDSVIWLYGSGFPKSLDVSKAIDKANGKPAPPPDFQSWLGAAIHERYRKHTALAVEMGVNESLIRHWTGKAGDQDEYPTLAKFQILKEKLGLDDRYDYLIEWAEAEREIIRERTMIQGGGNAYQLREGERREAEANITAAATQEAQQWQGWGTALKPAHEPIVLARKPLVGTVAQNVQTHGTGALNIDATRVGADVKRGERYGGKAPQGGDGGVYGAYEMHEEWNVQPGRWPANVALSHLPECEGVGTRRVKSDGARPQHKSGAARGWSGGHSDEDFPERLEMGEDGTEQVEAWRCAPGCSVAELDRQSGKQVSGIAVQRNGGGQRSYAGYEAGERPDTGYGDTGGASRFFYTAKASRAERNAGLDGFEEREASVEDKRAYQSVRCDDCKRLLFDHDAAKCHCENRSGFTRTNINRNHHPTVKPIDLMRWLVRLVTSPNGTILDPFMGSGTTGIAAALEGFDFIGIEREAEYAEIAKARIEHWQKYPEGTETKAALKAEAKERKRKAKAPQEGLFE